MFSSDIIIDALTGVGPYFENISFKNYSCPSPPAPFPFKLGDEINNHGRGLFKQDLKSNSKLQN
jgi:hypothetical protein